MVYEKVALITPWHRRGGIANYAERFVNELSNLDVEVAPVSIENSNTMNPMGFVNLPTRVPDDADVIHVQFEAGLFGRFGISGIGAPAFFYTLEHEPKPVVTTLHEVHHQHSHRSLVGDLALRTRDTLIERLALWASDVTMVHTRKAEQVLRDRHGSLQRIQRVLHPVDADVDTMNSSRAKDALDVTGKTLLTFGWVEKKKRYEDIIRALPGFPSVTYLIAGGKRPGEGERVLESAFNLAEELGVEEQVRYLGYVDENEVSTVFSAANAVVLPYERVSQSGVVNDALAHQCPVVTSALPAFEELRDRYRCLLTYHGHTELHNRIESVLYDGSTRDALQSRRDEYIKAVSWGKFTQKMKEIHRQVLE